MRDGASDEWRPTTLHARGLAVRAGGTTRGRLLVENGTFVVQPQERWVVLGPNGAGKSSLLAAVAGVFPLASGTVSVDDRPLAAWDGRGLASRRAWCPQFWSDPFPATVRETLALAGSRTSATAAAHDPRLDQWVRRLDLDGLQQADVRTLSGGERQRVALGTTLLQGAPLLLLDEPASHLDLRHRQLLLALLIAHALRGGSVVACMHDLDLAWSLATHAVLLDGRGACMVGPRETVMTTERLGSAFGVTIEVMDIGDQRRFGVRFVPPAGDACAAESVSPR